MRRAWLLRALGGLLWCTLLVLVLGQTQQPPTGIGRTGAPVAGQAASWSGSAQITGSTGLLLDGTDILARKDKITNVTGDTTLGAHNIVTCTAGATERFLTLPAAGTTTVGSYRIIKDDTGAGACTVRPATGERINNVVNGTTSATAQGEVVEVTLVSPTTPNWQAVSSITPFRTNPRTTTYQVVPSDFSTYKTIPVASGTFTITLVPSGATQPPNGQFIRIINYGSGVVTIAPSGQNINGVAGTLTVPAASATAPTSALIVSDGTHYVAAVAGAPPAALEVRSIYFPAGSMDVGGACASNAAAVLVTNGPKLPTISCTDVDTDQLYFDTVMPDGWNGGTVTVELAIVYSGTTHDAHVFDMNFSGQCVRHGDTVAAFAITSGATAESSANVDVQFTATEFTAGANRELHVTSAPITLAGTCAGGAHLYMHGLVDAGSTTFTPMTELKIVGVKLEYTRTIGDD